MCHAYCGPLTLGEDDYFFMGDNRTGSRDSRNFGPVPGEQIIGRVIMRYWPLNDFALYE
jgi:signal peptidase I